MTILEILFQIVFAIILIIIGWALGMLSSLIIPLISDKIKKYISKKEVKRGINIELKELQLRLTGICWTTTTKYGDDISEDWANWMKPYYPTLIITDEYDYIRDEFIKRKDYSKYTDEVFFRILSEYQKREKSNNKKATPTITKMIIPYLESKFNTISLFKEEYQMEITKLRREIINFNEDCEQLKQYHFKTFDDVSDYNLTVIYNNKNEILKRISRKSKGLIKLIENIFQY